MFTSLTIHISISKAVSYTITMTKHLSKKSKKIISNRVVIVINLLALCAIILLPFLYHVPYVTTIEILAATIAIGVFSGLISNGVLRVIFGVSVTILGAGSIVFDHPKYLILLFYPLMFVALVLSSIVSKRIARKILPYNSYQFQAIVSVIAVLVLFVLSIAVALHLKTPTPPVPLIIAVIFALAAGYVSWKVASNQRMKSRKPIIGTVLIVTVAVTGFLMASWPVLLMVVMLNFINGIFISALFQQSNAIRSNKKFNA